MDIIAYRDPYSVDEDEIVYGFYNGEDDTIVCACCGAVNSFDDICEMARERGWSGDDWYKFYPNEWVDLTEYLVARLKMKEIKNQL